MKENPKFSKFAKFGRKMLLNVKNITVPVKFANFVYFCITYEKLMPFSR